MAKRLVFIGAVFLTSCVDSTPSDPSIHTPSAGNSAAYSEAPPQGTPGSSVDAQLWNLAK